MGKAEEMINRVIEGEDPADIVQEAMDDDAWDQAQADQIYRDLRESRIKMLSAQETDEAVAALKRKWAR
jgi:hypothetical protein